MIPPYAQVPSNDPTSFVQIAANLSNLSKSINMPTKTPLGTRDVNIPPAGSVVSLWPLMLLFNWIGIHY